MSFDPGGCFGRSGGRTCKCDRVSACLQALCFANRSCAVSRSKLAHARTTAIKDFCMDWVTCLSVLAGTAPTKSARRPNRLAGQLGTPSAQHIRIHQEYIMLEIELREGECRECPELSACLWHMWRRKSLPHHEAGAARALVHLNFRVQKATTVLTWICKVPLRPTHVEDDAVAGKLP